MHALQDLTEIHNAEYNREPACNYSSMKFKAHFFYSGKFGKQEEKGRGRKVQGQQRITKEIEAEQF